MAAEKQNNDSVILLINTKKNTIKFNNSTSTQPLTIAAQYY